jgi:hypothetical protein
MPWYQGPSLLELLEQLPSSVDTRTSPFRFPVQRVSRPDRTFRGFAGQIASGTIRKGDAITVQPSGRNAKVERIVTWDGDLEEAVAPLSVTLVLDREVDISRGDLIVAAQAPATVSRNIEAGLVWMDQRPLELNRRYLLKQTSQTVPVHVTAIKHRTDPGTLDHQPAHLLHMNDIGVATLNLLRPIALDAYGEIRGTGAFILVDAETNGTVAAGMTRIAHGLQSAGAPVLADTWGPVTAGEREARWGHRGGVLELTGPKELIDAIERSLFERGAATVRMDADNEAFVLHPQLKEIVTGLQVKRGLLALVTSENESGTLKATAEGKQIVVETESGGETDGAVEAGNTSWANKVVAAVHQLLLDAEILVSSEMAGL